MCAGGSICWQKQLLIHVEVAGQGCSLLPTAAPMCEPACCSSPSPLLLGEVGGQRMPTLSKHAQGPLPGACAETVVSSSKKMWNLLNKGKKP